MLFTAFSVSECENLLTGQRWFSLLTSILLSLLARTFPMGAWLYSDCLFTQRAWFLHLFCLLQLIIIPTGIGRTIKCHTQCSGIKWVQRRVTAALGADCPAARGWSLFHAPWRNTFSLTLTFDYKTLLIFGTYPSPLLGKIVPLGKNRYHLYHPYYFYNYFCARTQK